MFRQICVAALLLCVHFCEADNKCTAANANDVCKPPLYKLGECETDKCTCAAGLKVNTAGTECELDNPTIKEVNEGNKYYLNEDYQLECNTDAKEITFKWFKGTDVIQGATFKTVTIKETTESANPINYKCEISLGQTKATSEDASVMFIVPGKDCTNVPCTGEGFTGTCGQTKRCVCAANYVAKEDTCKNGAAVVTTSLLLLVVTIFSQMVKLL